MVELAPLEDVLAYDNPDVPWKFRESFAVSQDEAELLFREVRRFLWLCAHRQTLQPAPTDLPEALFFIGHENLRVLDEMWHCFVLFAREYERFCLRYFGHVIYHYPSTRSDRLRREERFKADPEAAMEKQQRHLNALVGYVLRTLGEDIAELWLKKIPRQFPPERLNAIRVPIPTGSNSPGSNSISR